MSSTVEREAADEASPSAREIRGLGNVGDAPLSLLLGTQWALGVKHVVAAALFAGWFLFLSLQPLWHTDLWDHVAYGGWMLEHGALPQEDPFLPLARGVPIVCSMWLSQVGLAAVERYGGNVGLMGLFAATVTLAYVLLAVALYLRGGRLGLSLAGVGLMFLLVGWNRHLIIRPEMFGTLLFNLVVLWYVLAERKQAAEPSAAWGKSEVKYWPIYLGLPLTFALWANLHGSFVTGLAVLGCIWLGRVIDVAWQARSVSAVTADAEVRRWLLLGELALLGACLNPYGLDLVVHNLAFTGHENLQSVTEWDPLVITSPYGKVFAASWLVVLVAARASRRRVQAAEVLLLALFTYTALKHVRMLSWYAPVVALVVVPHLAGLWQQWFPRRELIYVSPVDVYDVPLLERKSWALSFCAVGVVWILFALSSVWTAVAFDRQPANAGLSKETPRKLAEHLRQQPPRGQIWNPQMWGGWLVFAGHAPDRPPPEVFMTSNIHVAPATVWQDYLRVFEGFAGWGAILDRYRVHTVVLDVRSQKQLAAQLRAAAEWRLEYQDPQAEVYVRTEPIRVTADGQPAADSLPHQPLPLGEEAGR